ncbi:hypothetical protein, partial [Mesorhizobium sp. M7A.F.Ca.US.007.01.1.1]|uniref:hypothetical protein n=1 Tax=Mesorhizobium sp. M7A.F.Ca.US.007.01.1.1 TaxID=2496712 RepID=UPI001FDFE436
MLELAGKNDTLRVAPRQSLHREVRRGGRDLVFVDLAPRQLSQFAAIEERTTTIFRRSLPAEDKVFGGSEL